MTKPYLGINWPQAFYFSHSGIDQNELGVSFTPSPWHASAVRYMTAMFQMKLYRPITWHILGAAAMLLLWRRWVRTRAFLAAVLASGTFYWLLSIPLIPAAEYRYQSWSVAASALLVFAYLALLIDQLARSLFGLAESLNIETQTAGLER